MSLRTTTAPPRGLRAAALALALAASSGCRSLLPQDDDSTLTTIGKGFVIVPVCVALLAADGFTQDKYDVSLLGDDRDDREADDRIERRRVRQDLERPRP